MTEQLQLEENAMEKVKLLVNAELVHNWIQRYEGMRDCPLAELSASCRAALKRASIKHHHEGQAAGEAAQFPDELWAKEN